MPGRKRVLITGAAGLVGNVLRQSLASSYDVRGVDIRPVEGVPGVVADMTDLTALHGAFEGIDLVIDLAAKASLLSHWDDIYANNLLATYNALQAAQKAGVQRLVFASSNHVTGMYEEDPPYSDIVAGRYQGLDPSTISRIHTEMPIRPDGPYGIGKAFGESAGRFFADNFALSVLCIRIGTVNRENRPVNTRQFATLLTHRDLNQLVNRCLEAPLELKFAVFYGVSNNLWRFWDIGNAESLIGYRPQDDAESWR